MKKTSELLVLALIFVATIEGVVGLVPCDLKWVADGYGNHPNGGIECGSGDFVARVSHGGKWIPGRMSPSRGKAFITEGGVFYEHDTYEILTNPEGCQLQWIEGYGGSIPEYGVNVDPLQSPAVYIGKGVIGGKTLGGKVIPDESAIFIAYEEKEELRRNYHVLISTYPQLQGSLSSFKFDISNIDPKLNHSELIGQEEIWLKLVGTTGATGAQHLVRHGKNVVELFSLSSTGTYDWTGISNLDFSFPLWYGSSDVSGEFVLDDGIKDLDLTVRREREIRIEQTLSVAKDQHFEACSIAIVYDDPTMEIPFTSIGYFQSQSQALSPGQISKVLQGLGMTVLQTKGKGVLAVVEGTLTGRFAVHASTYVFTFNPSGICRDVIW